MKPKPCTTSYTTRPTATGHTRGYVMVFPEGVQDPARDLPEGPADSMTKSAALHQCPLEPVARHFICADVRKYNDVTGLPHV